MVLISPQIISFILGFALQSIQVTFVTFGISTLLLSLVSGESVLTSAHHSDPHQVIVPPWPMYNRHPVVFLAAKPEVQEDTKKSE